MRKIQCCLRSVVAMCLSAVPLYGGDDNDIPEPAARKTFREIAEEFPPRIKRKENIRLFYDVKGKVSKLDSDAVHFYELVLLLMRNIHAWSDEVWVSFFQEKDTTKKIFSSLLSDECEVISVRNRRKWMDVHGFKRECRDVLIGIVYKDCGYWCRLLFYNTGTELHAGGIRLMDVRGDVKWELCEPSYHSFAY